MAPRGAKWRKSAAVSGGGVGCEFVAGVNKYKGVIQELRTTYVHFKLVETLFFFFGWWRPVAPSGGVGL